MKKISAFKVSRILCPVDFGDLSDLALKYAPNGSLIVRARRSRAERFRST